MKFWMLRLLTIVFFLIYIIGCSEGKMEKNIQYNNLNDITDSVWEKLAGKKIFFGHHSVGRNIIDGMKDLIIENPQMKLKIAESYDLSAFQHGVFAHGSVGKNTDPKSKGDEFVKFIEDGIGKKVDTAFFKFCYVDITAKTDVHKVFEDYKKTISYLKEKYPTVSFIHITCPLRTTQTTWKTWLKKIIGKEEIWEYDDNIRRNDFNALMIEKYAQMDTIFDIAKIESTRSNGERVSFSKDGKVYYHLAPEYTYDGGHLNEAGRKKVAEQLILLLIDNL